MGTTEWIIVLCVASILLCIVGLIGGYFIRVKQHDKSLQVAREKAESIVAEGKLNAEKIKKESIYEAKQEIQDLKREASKDIEERRSVVKE